MPYSQMSLSRFFQLLERELDQLYPDEPPFTLILGAGASRSAGIPLTSEMIRVLRSIVKWSGYPRDDSQPGESEFSLLLGTIAEFADHSEVREFIRRCIRRGSREPNITHLIAANLTCTRFFRSIVTTNFDDLALAAFWNLPVNDAYEEPYVIYDPRPIGYSKLDLGEEVPVIIKAHGHHTDYGMGLIEHQISDLIPSVKRALRWSGRPKLGYLVVGYSGSWDDGVMAALQDRRLVGERTIYWFFRGKTLPATDALSQLMRVGNVCFIRCDDSDYLFLRLLHFLRTQPLMGSGWLLTPSELFTPPNLHDIANERSTVGAKWWWPRPAEPKGGAEQERRLQQLRTMSDAELRRELGISKLRKQFVPILDKIDKWDNELLLPYDCVPQSLRHHVDPFGAVEFSGREAPDVLGLNKAIGPHISWTRRNLKLFRLAMHGSLNPFQMESLLSSIDRMSRL